MQDVNLILANHKGLGAVRLCNCNTIHLSIGPITIALAPEAFAQAAALMQQAQLQLKKINESGIKESCDTSADPHATIKLDPPQWTH